MLTTHCSLGGLTPGRGCLEPCRRRHVALLTTALAVGLSVGSWGAASAVAADVIQIDIGSVSNFQNGSNLGPGGEEDPNPTGTWTIGDKDFTYLKASDNWNGREKIQLKTNIDPSIFSHQFLIDGLSAYSAPITLELDYQVHINGALGPNFHFFDVFLGSLTSGKTVDVWKDVFDSEAGYLANSGHATVGAGEWHLHSLNGLPDSAAIPGSLIDLWVRDTIQLGGEGGQVSSINNTFRQTDVPEIDPNSFGSALAVVMGGLSLLERRARRLLRQSAVA